MVPHSAVIANVLQVAASDIPGSRAARGDRALGVIPFSHMYGLLALVHLCPYLGISTVVYESMPSFAVFLEGIFSLKINHLYLAPPLVNAFVKHPASSNYDFTFLKTATIAAAPLSAEVESAFQMLGGPNFLISQGFGMTETSGLVTGLPAGVPPLQGSVGQLLTRTEAKVIDVEGNILGTGCRGELCVRGPQLCLGYLNNPDATRDAFDKDGFLFTGDLVELTSDGYIIVVDRLKHMIKNKVSRSKQPERAKLIKLR